MCLITADDGIRVQHLHDLGVVALHQIKWGNRFDEVAHNFMDGVAVAEPVLHDSQIRVTSIQTGIHRRCMAIRTWAMGICKMIRTMHHFIRLVILADWL